MLTLYYRPAYCSMSAHIALQEAALPHRLIRVDLQTGRTEDGQDYRHFNDKAQVPALRLDNGEGEGEILTESAAVLQYIADAAPASGLAPPAGTLARYRLQEWLNFLATELHKRGSLLVSPHTPEVMRPLVVTQLHQRLAWLEQRVTGRNHLLGSQFSVADAHLFFLLHGMLRLMRLDLRAYPTLLHMFNTWRQRPAVQAVLRLEQLDT